MPIDALQADPAEFLLHLLPAACVALHLHDPHSHMGARQVCKPAVPLSAHATMQH